VTDGDDARVVVDEACELREIDAASALFTHAHLDTVGVAHAQPGINIRGKLAAEGDDVIAGAPGQAVGDG
jgi:hypothetical protein